MKRFCIVFSFFCVVLLMTSCDSRKDRRVSNSGNPKAATDRIDYQNSGHIYKGNYVWSKSMTLAWKDFTNNAPEHWSELRSGDSFAMQTINKLNDTFVSNQDINSTQLFNYSGYGIKALRKSLKIIRKSYPHWLEQETKIQMPDADAFITAYTVKDIVFKLPFNKSVMKYNGKTVESFIAPIPENQWIKVIDYKDDDHFLLSVGLDDYRDLLFLAKGYPMDKPDSLITYLRDLSDWKSRKVKYYTDMGPLTEDDVFIAPVIELSYRHDYTEMIGKSITANGSNTTEYNKFKISTMYEYVYFNMSGKGVKIPNDAKFYRAGLFTMRKIPPRYLIMDKPFWIVMIRTKDGHSSFMEGLNNNPYLILGINNTEFMEQKY